MTHDDLWPVSLFVTAIPIDFNLYVVSILFTSTAIYSMRGTAFFW